MGFFKVKDVPSRRVVQYSRVSGSSENVVFIEDESVLGTPVDDMPFADKTGIVLPAAGMLYEIPYLADAGDVYFSVQPQDVELADGSATITVEVKAGKAPYVLTWYKDGKEVVNVPEEALSLTVNVVGEYFVKVTDADGVGAVSKAVKVAEPE
ncbi:TPA: immunoglobulin domain-containing protein [Salmonella enterica subsp. enterica serovar Dublin]|nr:immunoglobulin domain-containing protein [Salmonella enterica subsp. enterica serovar Dublin]HCC9823708.1 immunoglobulin domain-containing protein [Salmonella enterica subsp. enterica serovar Dublin]